jgi:hypothetical protein
MNDAQTIAPTNKSATWLWSGLIGAAIGLTIGATVASGIFWLLMRAQEQRFNAYLVEKGLDEGLDLARGVFKPVIGQVGDLLGQSSGETKAEPEAKPTKDEIAAYFEGKTLPLPEGDNALLVSNGEKSAKTCVMTKDGLEAVEKGSSYQDYSTNARNTTITFLYKTDDARYAVDANLVHKPIGDKTGFFGFTVTKVAKQ